ncbi:MAG: hypothetical protein J5882_05465 [Bacteroidales bacterium]|nr:hypothetical protein [Bacteroidales bacterium]
MSVTKSLLAAVLIAAGANAVAQNFYSSEKFAAAVANGTRTETGVPGSNYKCNFAKYKIDAKFDDDAEHLYGEETVVYSYNSGENNLDSIVVNLYRDVYKTESVRHRNVDRRDLFDGINIAEVARVENKNRTPLTFTRSNTQMTIALDKAINPGDSVTLYIKWDTKIASRTHLRGGKYGTNSWVIPYWYPQVAVYDDIFGWDRVQHSGNEEFYFEFANYDVNITLGHHLAAWATGTLQNPDKIYSKAVYQNYLKALKSEQRVDIITDANIQTAIPKETNTWHFKADSVVDFLFCCSNESKWSGLSFTTHNGGHRILSSAVYRHNVFPASIDITKSTINYLSNERPAVHYPYPHMTIFEGSGGMEFPMMVNESCTSNTDLNFTTSHEVTHSYFPFITGMNQNKFGFMDEGLTMYVPQYMQRDQINAGDQLDECKSYLSSYLGSMSEVPIFTPSYQYKGLWSFTMISYYAPQMGYYIIEQTIGSDNMRKALNQFVNNWKGKHPHPYDLFHTFESVSGKDLTAFYQNWFKETGFADMGVDSVFSDVKNQKHSIVIGKHGDKIVPATIKITYTNGDTELVECSIEQWKPHDKTVTLEVNNNKEIKKAEIIESYYPDKDTENNIFYIQKQ